MEEELFLEKGRPIKFEFLPLEEISFPQIDEGKVSNPFHQRSKRKRIKLASDDIPIRCPLCSLSVIGVKFSRTKIKLECSHFVTIREYNALLGTRTIQEIARHIVHIWLRENGSEGRQRFVRYKILLRKLHNIQSASDRFEGESGKEIIEEFIREVLSPRHGRLTWWGWSHPRAEHFKHELILKISEVHVDYRWDRHAQKRFWKNQEKGKGVYA